MKLMSSLVRTEKMVSKTAGKIFMKIKRHSPTIMSVISCGGVIGVAVLSSKAAVKTAADIEELHETKEKVTPREIILAAAKNYGPTIAATAGTIGCILLTDKVNRGRQAALMAAACAATDKFNNAKAALEDKVGKEEAKKLIAEKEHEKNRDIEEPFMEYLHPGPGEEVFFDQETGTFFCKDPEEVKMAIYNLNQKFMAREYATLADWIDLLGRRSTYEDTLVGWSVEAGYMKYGYSWITCDPLKIVNPKNPDEYYYHLAFDNGPTADFMEF